MSGEYESIYEMAADMNGGTKKLYFKNIMRIMLK